MKYQWFFMWPTSCALPFPCRASPSTQIWGTLLFDPPRGQDSKAQETPLLCSIYQHKLPSTFALWI